ncbi:MAG: hypothetical protein U0836_21260 [Pirellulales bacterium]
MTEKGESISGGRADLLSVPADCPAPTDATDRAIMLALAGTTALPQPFPAVANLRILCGADKSAYLEIRVLRAPYDSLRYTVHVDDVRAICYAKDKQPPTRIDRGNLDFGDGVARRVKEDQPGIVFVRDNASVLVTHEYGTTAQEIPDCRRPEGRCECRGRCEPHG